MENLYLLAAGTPVDMKTVVIAGVVIVMAVLAVLALAAWRRKKKATVPVKAEETSKE